MSSGKHLPVTPRRTAPPEEGLLGNHLPVDYRGRFEQQENRYGPPGEVCDTCSDLEDGHLVPVAFCPRAYAALCEYEDWLAGAGERPVWLDSPDAMIVKF